MQNIGETEMDIDNIIYKRIEEEAFLHHKKDEWKDALQNWGEAKNEIMDRIRFIAYYLHVNNLNKPALDNWVEAQKIYIKNF